MPSLPARPSREHLRKQAKRLARERSVGLAAAQHLVAERLRICELGRVDAARRGGARRSRRAAVAAVRRGARGGRRRRARAARRRREPAPGRRARDAAARGRAPRSARARRGAHRGRRVRVAGRSQGAHAARRRAQQPCARKVRDRGAARPDRDRRSVVSRRGRHDPRRRRHGACGAARCGAAAAARADHGAGGVPARAPARVFHRSQAILVRREQPDARGAHAAQHGRRRAGHDRPRGRAIRPRLRAGAHDHRAAPRASKGSSGRSCACFSRPVRERGATRSYRRPPIASSTRCARSWKPVSC